ncbi:hypothetical protein OF377_02830 [Ureaplasma sp. ES3154-GEN]|uniref:Vmc-like lipoprotein signal peptide domain-containing protein n=1 Tax=Ureaplasma sp. ES3154-GEN TaxID=2984844 RepID=UPI0021E74A04|nr:hypothetical protein [Ureaplasma sp. ES3154-GEN]MCV3743796.1 hypothetical protein [Ureaplasma sp. ES3154-GEN]
MTKKNKKIILASLGAFVGIASITSIAAACKPVRSENQVEVIKGLLSKTEKEDGVEVNLWKNWWNSPFAQLLSLAKDLDKAIDLNKSSTFKPLIAAKQHEDTFEKEAIKQIAKIKADIKMYANSPFWKKLRDQNTTVGFTARGGESSLDVNIMNSFGLLQPAENPLLYTSPDFDDLPGLGMKFPTPNKEGISLLDSWYSFGWKASSDDSADVKAQAVKNMIAAFSNKFNKLVYVYNDGQKTDAYTGALDRNFETTLANTKNFLPTRLVQGNKPENVVFMGRSGWIATYGIVGMHWLLREYSRLLGMPEAELKDLMSKEQFKVNKNPTALFSEDDLMTKNVDGKMIKVFKSDDVNPWKNQKRPDKTDINFWVTSVHTLDQSIVLGVRPNIFIEGKLSTSGHDRPTSINYLYKESGEWIKELPRFGSRNEAEKAVDELKNTHNALIYALNVNTMTSGTHNLTKDGNIMKSENWGPEYPNLIPNIAWTSRRFRTEDRLSPANEKDTQLASLTGYEAYKKAMKK